MNVYVLGFFFEIFTNCWADFVCVSGGNSHSHLAALITADDVDLDQLRDLTLTEREYQVEYIILQWKIQTTRSQNQSKINVAIMQRFVDVFLVF